MGCVLRILQVVLISDAQLRSGLSPPLLLRSLSNLTHSFPDHSFKMEKIRALRSRLGTHSNNSKRWRAPPGVARNCSILWFSMEIHQYSTGQRTCTVVLGQTLRPGGKSGDLLIPVAMLTNYFDQNRQKSVT